jgi:serine/threonine protein kinase
MAVMTDPATVGPYEIVGRLGEGGMGSVYLGRSASGQLAAVKLIRPELALDPGFRRRFAAEAANGQRVASFCTAAFLGSGMEGDRPYLATEYIKGPTLADHIARSGALPPSTLQSFAIGVAAALTAIHAAGLVHRDLKPSNVILSVSGPRVIDFGIARALDMSTGLTAAGELVGSPGWLAPEQIRQEPTGTAADIYTWGCLVAYAGRAGHPHGSGDFAELAARILYAEPDLDGLPDTLRRIVAMTLDKDPSRRPTARDLLLTLSGGDLPAPTRREASPPPIDLLVGGGEWPPATRLEVSPAGDERRETDREYLRRLVLGGLAFAVGLALLVAGVLLLG